MCLRSLSALGLGLGPRVSCPLSPVYTIQSNLFRNLIKLFVHPSQSSQSINVCEASISALGQGLRTGGPPSPKYTIQSNLLHNQITPPEYTILINLSHSLIKLLRQSTQCSQSMSVCLGSLSALGLGLKTCGLPSPAYTNQPNLLHNLIKLLAHSTQFS